MPFDFEYLDMDEAKELYTRTRDTMLSRVCDDLVKSFVASDRDATPPITVAYLESAEDYFGDWQTKQRERKDGDDGEKVQVINADAIARKINADKDKTDVRAIRQPKDGTFGLVRASRWTEDSDTETPAS